MITFSEDALAHIGAILKRQNKSMFRLSVKRTGCSGYMYQPEVVDQMTDSDELLNDDYPFQIMLDRSCIDLIKGTSVDIVAKPLGQRQLVFNNPNAQGECGCGESFTIKEDEAS